MRTGQEKGRSLKEMSQHLIDTRPRLGTCVRCGAYVLTCLVAGGWTGVDTVPLALDALRGALAAGRPVYRLMHAVGQAQALRLASLGDVQRGTQLLAEHACAGRPMDARAVQELSPVPLSAPVSGTGRLASRSASETPHRGTQSLAPATPATRHRSRARRCANCKALIKRDELYWGIECGTYLWAVHDECPGKRDT